METMSLRQINDGRQYDPLFPTPIGENITVKEDADVDDTLKLIQQKVHEDRMDTLRAAKMLKGKDLYETCENIWDFVYTHIQYKKDEKFIEQVRRPARAWADRHTGVDCDCYSTFISSILINLGIPHKLRITKYGGENFQHIYPIVPKDFNANRPLNRRADYITVDCVKNAYDDEQAFTDYKDYNMRLDYLNGLEEDESPTSFGGGNMGSIDAQDLANTEDDQELNGKFGKWLKKTTKKVGDKIGDGIRVINRFANPATILLRNGFLLAMKVNLLKVASKLRYGYLTDEQAKAMNMDLDALNKVRHIKDKAETIYWQCGGHKENLKKAILDGKGNADKKVPMNGLEGLDAVYADQDEYNILKYGTISGITDLDELGDPASGTALAAATGAVTALAAALKQVKGLFKKDSPEAAEFEEATPTTTAPTPVATMSIEQDDFNTPGVPAAPPTIVNKIDFSNQRTAAPAIQTPNFTATENLSTMSNTLAPTTTATATTTSSTETEPGFFTKAGNWIKANPGTSVLIGAALLGGGYMLLKKKEPEKPKGKRKKQDDGMNGTSQKPKGKKAKPKSKTQIKTIKF